MLLRMIGSDLSGGRGWRQIVAAILLAASLPVVISGCAWFDAQQRNLIYRPTPGTVDSWKPITEHDEALWLDLPLAPGAAPGTAPQRLRAMWVPQPDTSAPAVLYLHGTFRNVFQNQPKIRSIHDAGFSVLAVEYRGYGDSSFQLPSEQSVQEDVARAWQELQRRAPDPTRRVIYGHSMGSGAATTLAWSQREAAAAGTAPPPYGALVLESAFTSLPDIARNYGAVGNLIAPLATQRFESIHKIGDITAPKWFIAGSKDDTVPPVHSQRLYDAARGERYLVMIEGGGHSRLNEDDPKRYAAAWADVARAVGGSATAPERKAAKPAPPTADQRR